MSDTPDGQDHPRTTQSKPPDSEACWTAEHPSIPDYELTHRLGAGGFGEVWMARSRTGVWYACKIIPRSRLTEIEYQGVRDFEVFGRQHPNLVQIRHVGELEGVLYYVMELADGYDTAPTFDPEDYQPRSVASDLARNGPYPLADAIRITRQVLGGLAHLHANGLLHRDVKPANIIFVGGEARLSDVGLVTRHDRSSSRAHTPGYAPEGGVVDPSGDLYCLGRTLREMVTGRSPVQDLDETDDVSPTQQEALDRLHAVLAQACAGQPNGRFRSAEAMLEALPRTDRQAGRRWFIAAAASVAAVAAGAAIAWSLLRPDDQPSGAPVSADSSASFEVQWKPPGDGALLYRNDPGGIPLGGDDLVAATVEFQTPQYAVIYYCDPGMLEDDKPKATLVYPDPEKETWPDRPRTKLRFPDDSPLAYEPLNPADTTLTWILLARPDPITRDEAEQLRSELFQLGPPPELIDELAILENDGRVDRIPAGETGRIRGLPPPDKRRVVRAKLNMLDRLHESLRERFPVIRAVAMPQVEATEEDIGDSD